jgi:hypothetical protein
LTGGSREGSFTKPDFTATPFLDRSHAVFFSTRLMRKREVDIFIESPHVTRE